MGYSLFWGKHFLLANLSESFIIIIIILVYLTAHQHISGHTARINNLELQIYFGIKYGNVV